MGQVRVPLASTRSLPQSSMEALAFHVTSMMTLMARLRMMAP